MKTVQLKSVCIHCKEPLIKASNGMWVDTLEKVSGTAQYCWIDPMHGSKTHVPVVIKRG